MKSISDRIKEGLDLRNMKQTDLVEKTGISKGAMSSYVSGRYQPKQNNIHLIAKALNVSEAWLMGADVSINREPGGTEYHHSVILHYNQNGVLREEDIPSSWVKKGDQYLAIVVHGDSMYPRLMEGDVAVIRLQDNFTSGQDCAFYLGDDEDPTIKTLHKNNDGTITMKPANPEWMPRTVPAEEIRLLGVVKRIRRDFDV